MWLRAPDGAFRGAPRRVWRLTATEAVLAGEPLGAPRSLPELVRLGDFWLPQRPLFFADAVSRFDPAS